ncbi:MAG: hypothetical protein IT439_04075 [Phycisphaerales bacterium]|nr:hypothetical protein [Phycisphaerales bacterium]
MLTRRNTRFLHLARAWVALAAILGPVPSVSAGHAPMSEPAPPTPDETFIAFRAVRERVLRWDATEPTGFACRGACVTLRLRGETVGRGVWIAQDESIDRTLDLAVRDAMEQAGRRLLLPADATRAAALREIAPQLTISLELAGELVPLAPEALADATLLISPGLEGVAVRLGTRVVARFPESFIESGATPGHTLRVLASDVSGETALALMPLDELRQIPGLAFYHFRTTHLAQIRPGAEPEFLRRSGLHVDQRSMNSAALRAWASALAGHLARAVGPEGELTGTWLPVPGKADDAPPGEVARGLAALALRRAVDHTTSRGGVPEPLSRALGALVNRQDERLASNPALLDDPAGAALWAGALSGVATPDGPGGRVLAAAERALDVGGDFTAQSPGVRAAGAWGLACLASPQHPERAARARDILVNLLQNAEPGSVVGLTPFIGWAQIALAEGEPTVAAAPLLRQTRSLMWANQLTPNDTGPEAEDLAGGLVFTSGKVPLPSWHTARPVSLASAMLGDPRLTTEDEFAAELMSLLSSLRFLRQLTADESTARMYRNPADALGGVRAAPWDQHMPIEATSITLITVLDTIESLEAVAARRAGR